MDATVLQSIKKKKVEQQLFVSVTSNQQQTQVVFGWTKYSSFSEIVRLTAYILRLLPRHRHFRSRDLKITDSIEINLAEEKVLLLSQRESFRDELKCLFKEKSIANTSRIRSFSPFVGPGGLLRSTGRTKRLDAIEFDTKHPIILDCLHPVVPLMLENLHKCHHHQGLDFMRSQVQQRFAVLRLRQMLRKVENECLVCRKRKAQTLTPMMADLPKERLAFQSPPFTMTGVDYFGPSFEEEGFIARRGTPSVIWSDNGTNFVGAEKASYLYSMLDQPSIMVHKKLT